MTILNKFYSISKDFNNIEHKYRLASKELVTIEEQKNLLTRTSILSTIMMLSILVIAMYLFTNPDVIFQGYHPYFQALSVLISFTFSGGLFFFTLYLIYNAFSVNKDLSILKDGVDEISVEIEKNPILLMFLKEIISNNVEFDNKYLELLNEKDKKVLALNIYKLYFMVNEKINIDFNLKRRLANTNYKPSFTMV